MSDNPCFLCGEKEKIKLCGSVPYNIVKCGGCSMVFVDPLPDKEFLESLYQKKYYDFSESQKKGRALQWMSRIGILDKFSKPGKLLDVGCGTGDFLKSAQHAGWDVQGTEFSGYSSREAGSAVNIPVFHGELEDANFPEASFDVITLWHVLEHIPDPAGLLQECRRILKDGGIMLVEVPNVNYALQKLKGYMNKGNAYFLLTFENSGEPHLNHFSSRHLAMAVSKAGFKVIKNKVGVPAYLSKSFFHNKWTYFYFRAAEFINFISGINIGYSIFIVARKV
ncbi:MAG: class I SAM-dependent methyltransferase [Firmicutes bacterium]|nr:class I SAM-dependent methyltransferase [Bacillota bacterium]